MPPISTSSPSPLVPARIRYVVRGQVQGVGFRPFVYRTASELGLTGSVQNTPQGVVVEVQGAPEGLDLFAHRLRSDLPPLAEITSLSKEPINPLPEETGFSIFRSAPGEGHEVLISPDVALCDACRAEILDPADRRHLYPFTNCTDCGPRFTITHSIPYDRPSTSMACFPMCARCRAEYDDPLNRRFHAQPNACPECGPHVRFEDMDGGSVLEREDALKACAAALLTGRIAAIKGLGGFHLACDAFSNAAVTELRTRKHRFGKPLAVMVRDMEQARRIAHCSAAEERLLTSRERPIVLLARKVSGLSEQLAPDTDSLGVMLPYTPLHVLLFELLAKRATPETTALVMTSGNSSSEPIALGNREARRRLSAIADVFLFHNRDILIRCDDSVVRVNPNSEKTEFLRRARGFTPRPLPLPVEGPSVLGVGPQLKATLCLTKKNQAFLSQHIGDLDNVETTAFFHETMAHQQRILRVSPALLCADLHPDYPSTRYVLEQKDLPVVQVQHHAAHCFAVLAEHGRLEPTLGLALDGTGLGEDRTLWGGELLLVRPREAGFSRLGHFAPMRLPGGEAAIREPWRIAQACLFALGIERPAGRSWTWLESNGRASAMVGRMLEKGINTPVTTSCGRLFDAVSALLGVCHAVEYEGQAAIRLERVQDVSVTAEYPCAVREQDGLLLLETLDLFGLVYSDWMEGRTPSEISRKFHLGLIRGLTDLAVLAAQRSGIDAVTLSGGVMQNATFAVLLPERLAAAGLSPLVHTHAPPNDGCISLGQAFFGQCFLALCTKDATHG